MTIATPSALTKHLNAVVLAATLVAELEACGSARSTKPRDSPITLRALYALHAPDRFMAATTAVVLVDFQAEFFAGQGRLPVDNAAAAVERAAALRRWANDHRILVVMVRNVATRADSPVFAASSPTSAIVLELAPAANDLLVTKHQAGAFSKTDLDASLRKRKIDTLIVAGIMTHLAVDTTVRDAAVLGYRVVVAADACATRALPSATSDDVISAAEVHRVALASLADRFADVLRVDRITHVPTANAREDAAR